MKKNKLLLGCTILVVFLFTTNLHGQQINSYTISGVVKDMQSGTPLFYANVGLLNAADSVSVQGVSTDEHGRFKLSNIKQGDYIFQASYIGYDIYRQPISVAGNKKEIVMDTVLLQPVSTTLEGFTIYEKKPVYAIEGEKKLYNVSEDPSIQTGTTSDALQNAPGVEVDIEGNITLRGVSSVEIWINDKPSRLNAENLKTYIQQLPANSLERIEVISNPSARYSSSGGGVINIVTKSNIKRNSFISFGVNGSTRPSVSPWISYMFANEKFSFNIYMYSYLSEQRTTSDGYNITFNENMDTSAHRIYKSKSDYDFLNGGMYINGSYNFDTMNSISFWVGAYGNPHQKAYVFEDYYYREFLSDIGIYNYTIETNAKTIYVGGYGGISYRHDFNKDGHNLSVDLSGNFWIWNHSENYSRIYQTYADRNINKITTFRNGNGSPSIEINYKLPYSKNGKIELGVESGFAPAYDYWAIDTLLANTMDTYVLDSVRYKDNHAKAVSVEGYLTVQQKIKNFTIKGGLRVKHTNVNHEVRNAPQYNINKDYTGLFPSLHLSYATEKMHNFSLSYTRRINFPTADRLTTFISYNEDSYSTGNPDLRSTFTNNVEAEWTKYYTKFGSVNLSAYFRNSKDEIDNLTDVIYSDYFERYVTYSMPVNSGKSHRYGLSANINYKLKAFMTIRLSANVYNAHSETTVRSNTEVMTDDFGYSFRLNFWAKLWKIVELNLSGNYRSKKNTLFRTEQPEYAIHGGLRMDFWKKKISLYLNVQDIFNWNRTQYNSTNPYYISYDSRKYNSRFISLGITFRFGKIELENQARTGGQM